MKTSHGNPFVFIEYYFPKEGKTEAILEIAQRSIKAVENKQGVLLAQVLKPDNDKGPVCNLLFFESKQKLTDLMKTEEFQKVYKSEDMTNVKEWTTDIQSRMFNTVDGWHQ